MSKSINIHEAKTNFSKLINRVINGEEITISKSGNAVAKLIPIQTKSEKRIPGSAINKIKIADNFDSPLPEDLLTEFEE